MELAMKRASLMDEDRSLIIELLRCFEEVLDSIKNLDLQQTSDPIERAREKMRLVQVRFEILVDKTTPSEGKSLPSQSEIANIIQKISELAGNFRVEELQEAFDNERFERLNNVGEFQETFDNQRFDQVNEDKNVSSLAILQAYFQAHEHLKSSCACLSDVLTGNFEEQV